MKVTVLIDNNREDGLLCEWGLAFHIEHNGRRYLLDCGASGAFARNAEALGIDLAAVDAAVLSHAHHDHGGGMETFFGINGTAPFFVAASASENCWARGWSHSHKGLTGLLKALFGKRYIGLPEGVLERYSGRLQKVYANHCISDGVWIVPHSVCGLSAAGRRQKMFMMRDGKLVPDDFSHEQSLVFDTPEGLVVLNSCSHSGPEVILREVHAAIPGKPVAAYIGGLHLHKSRPEEIRKVAESLKGVDSIYTGHCTGDDAFNILHEAIGGKLNQFASGTVISF